MQVLYHTSILWIHVIFLLDIFGALTTEYCKGARIGFTICLSVCPCTYYSLEATKHISMKLDVQSFDKIR
jgi:hypothetical protein